MASSKGPFISSNMVDDDFPVAALTPSQIFDALGTTVPTSADARESRQRMAGEGVSLAPESEHTGATTSLDSAPVLSEEVLKNLQQRDTRHGHRG